MGAEDAELRESGPASRCPRVPLAGWLAAGRAFLPHSPSFGCSGRGGGGRGEGARALGLERKPAASGASLPGSVSPMLVEAKPGLSV